MAKSTKNPSAAPLSCVPHIQPSRREYIHEVEEEESPKYNNNVTLWQTNYVLDLFAYVQQTQLLCKTTDRAKSVAKKTKKKKPIAMSVVLIIIQNTMTMEIPQSTIIVVLLSQPASVP